MCDDLKPSELHDMWNIDREAYEENTYKTMEKLLEEVSEPDAEGMHQDVKYGLNYNGENRLPEFNDPSEKYFPDL